MKVIQSVWRKDEGWTPALQSLPEGTSYLVLLFGDLSVFDDEDLLQTIRSTYPSATIIGCSTAGEISGTNVLDGSLVVTAVSFNSTMVVGTTIPLDNTENALVAGEKLALALTREGLAHVFVLSDGLKVNGSDLVKGLMQNLPAGVSVTGGLAADGERFQKTCIIGNGVPMYGAITAVGFYGDALKVGYGSMGGWDPFGPERRITRSSGNVLYEFDGQSALELYRKYLGEHASGLPATALLFPLSLRMGDGEKPVVRTVLSINENEQSMTFAGDMPQGAYARLMKANFDRLVDGAIGAARNSSEASGATGPDLAILISCVGRKMILKQRTEEEVEGVRDIFGEHAVLCGFYSYGELSPFAAGEPCALHNQTMTITTFSEK